MNAIVLFFVAVWQQIRDSFLVVLQFLGHHWILAALAAWALVTVAFVTAVMQARKAR